MNVSIEQLTTIESASGKLVKGKDGKMTAELLLKTAHGPIVLPLDGFDALYRGFVNCWPSVKPIKDKLVLARKEEILAEKVKARETVKAERLAASAAAKELREKAKADLQAAKDKLKADAAAARAKATKDAADAKAKADKKKLKDAADKKAKADAEKAKAEAATE